MLTSHAQAWEEAKGVKGQGVAVGHPFLAVHGGLGGVWTVVPDGERRSVQGCARTFIGILMGGIVDRAFREKGFSLCQPET